MAKFFLVVEPSCLKKRVLKPKCAVTNVDWNNLTFEFLAKDEQNLLATTSNYLRTTGTTRNFRTFQGLLSLKLIINIYKNKTIKKCIFYFEDRKYRIIQC